MLYVIEGDGERGQREGRIERRMGTDRREPNSERLRPYALN